MGIYRETTGTEIGFAQWMAIALPVVVVLLPVAWLWVTRGVETDADIQIPELGPWRSPERRVLVVFFLTAVAWVTRTAPGGGWSQLFDLGGAGDATVAMAAVVILFLLPDGEGDRMLDWETAERIPWGLLILFGGGIAIARAFESSGLSTSLGGALSVLGDLPVVLMVGGICLAVTFLTEVTSNTATTTLLMPVLAAAGVAADIDPMLFMVPATLSASCAFMLPVATAPNAIVFGTGRVPIAKMAREGFAINLAGTALITAVCVWLLS